MPKYTKHAMKRKQQRCINDALVAAVSTMGHRFYDKDGCVYVSASKPLRRGLAKELRHLAEKLEHPDPVFLVENADGSIKTVGHEYRRHHRH
jgi:hypothetical protein